MDKLADDRTLSDRAFHDLKYHVKAQNDSPFTYSAFGISEKRLKKMAKEMELSIKNLGHPFTIARMAQSISYIPQNANEFAQIMLMFANYIEISKIKYLEPPAAIIVQP